NCVLHVQLTRSYGRRLLGMALVVLSASSLLLSFSRGAIFACIVAGLLYLITGSRRVRGVMAAVTFTAAVIALLLWGASNDTLDLSAGERLGSFGGESRIEVISQFWTEYVLPHPALGIGFLRKEGYSDIQRGDPHNSLLLVWIEQGTIGLALLLLSLCI